MDVDCGCRIADCGLELGDSGIVDCGLVLAASRASGAAPGAGGGGAMGSGAGMVVGMGGVRKEVSLYKGTNGQVCAAQT